MCVPLENICLVTTRLCCHAILPIATRDNHTRFANRDKVVHDKSGLAFILKHPYTLYKSFLLPKKSAARQYTRPALSEILLECTHKGTLLLVCLEATVAKLGRSIDEFESNLLQS
jgi:hypothetical protein